TVLGACDERPLGVVLHAADEVRRVGAVEGVHVVEDLLGDPGEVAVARRLGGGGVGQLPVAVLVGHGEGGGLDRLAVHRRRRGRFQGRGLVGGGLLGLGGLLLAGLVRGAFPVGGLRLGVGLGRRQPLL